MTEQLHFHFSLSSIGEGNGNPLQCSCLENPRDGGAWWAAIYGVAQSRTRLKRLSSHLQCRRPQFDSWVGKIPWRRERLPTPVFWPGESHGQSLGSQRVGHDSATFTFIFRKLVTALLPRNNRALISYLQSLSGDFGAQQNKICHCFHFFPFSLP